MKRIALLLYLIAQLLLAWVMFHVISEMLWFSDTRPMALLSLSALLYLNVILVDYALRVWRGQR